jgi:hypothetical protein
MFLTRFAKVSLVFGVVFATANTGTAAMIGQYHLDELNGTSVGTTVFDTSPALKNGVTASDNVATPVGPTEGIASVNPIYGTAYGFDAITNLSYVNINPNGAGLTRDSALSYAAWIKPSSTQLGFSTFIGTSGRGYDFRVIADGSGGWNLRLASSNSDSSLAFATSLGSIPSDVWTHVAVTKDASGSTTTSTANVIFYINGVAGTPTTVLRAGATNSGAITNIFVGGGALTTRYFNGGVDEAYIYNEVLDATTIAGLAGVPEPSVIVLVGIGLIGLVGRCPRKLSNI